MSFEYIHTLPSAEHLKALLPISSAAAAVQKQKVDEMKQILSGEDPHRVLLIIGPCSADNDESGLD